MMSASFLSFGRGIIFAVVIYVLGGYIGATVVYLAPLVFVARRSTAHLFGRRWGSGAICALPLAAGILVVLYGRLAGEVLHFRLKKAEYDRFISAVIAGKCEAARAMSTSARYHADIFCKHPIVAIFPWDGYSTYWYGVVYDEDDDIHSTATPESEASVWLSCSAARTSLGGHCFIAGGIP